MNEYKNTIALPSSYFKTHTDKEYTNWREALVREFVQNGRDCGSKNIYIDFEDGKMHVLNDGKVMTLDTMLNVLLTLGGTFKEDPNSVGGFGQAKNLLYFRWNQWSVQSGEWIIKGSGPNYADPKQGVAIEGTHSVIDIHADGYDTQGLRAYAINYAKKCILGGSCNIHVDGDKIESEMHRGRKIKTLYNDTEIFAEAYFNKSVNNKHYVQVYAGGLFMFQSSYHDAEGLISIDLVKSSKDTLTANRDSLQYDYRSIVDQFAYELVKDSELATDEKSDTITLIPGSGPVSIRVKKNNVKEVLDLITLAENDDNDDNSISHILESIALLGTMQDRSVNEIRRKLSNICDAEQVSRYQIKELKNELKRLLDCDYIWVKEKDADIYNSRIDQYLETKSAKKLLRVWKEMILLVFDIVNHDIDFTPGFIFSNDTEAAVHRTDERLSILINPFTLPNKKDMSPHSYMDLLMQDAVHEVCHISCSYHDSTFVKCYHRTWTKCIARLDEFKAIMKSK